MSDMDWNDVYSDDPVAQGLRRKAAIRTVRTFTVHPLSNPRKVRSFLHQEKYWVDAQLEQRKIKEMDADHLASTMAFLLERAVKVFFFEDLRGEVLQGIPPNYIEDPRIRMMATPLFRSMKARYVKIMDQGQTKQVTELNVQD